MSADNIKVAIKARPVLKKEKDCNLCWKISNNSIQLIESQTEPFYFDHIFDQNSTNQNIFDTVVKPIINSTMKGINGTIFAYGQTSSGKTYTMLGDEENPGVMILAVKEIFKFIQNSCDRLFLLRVGYIEIYNEKIYDLLNKDNRDLKIHEANGDVNVNCSEFIVTSEEDIFKYLQAGNKIRKCGETNMNERSSRSHAIFKITVESRETQKNQENESDAIQISSLNLVDLAGSERADQTGATGSRLKEGSHINKSLLSLGCVIKSLSENADTDSFINYRNSKLTRILQASLGGNALTAIVCNIKLTTIEETNSTLCFAMRAKKIKNKPHVNESMSDAVYLKILEKKVSKLQSELELERQKISKFEVLKIEKQIKYETHKILHPQSLIKQHNDRNRRRTWCPSSCENNSNIEEDSKKSIEHIPIEKTANKISNFLTPLITLRNEKNCIEESEDDDLFRESPIFNDSISLGSTSKIHTFQTPKMQIFDKSNILEYPCLKDKYEKLEQDFKELETFTSLENKLDVDHNYLDSLISNLEVYRSEISNKNTEIKKLHESKLEMDIILENLKLDMENLKSDLCSKNNSVKKLEKVLENKEKELSFEIREKISVECELKQFKDKSKVREQELLELIKEKDNQLFKLQNLENKNSEVFSRENYDFRSKTRTSCTLPTLQNKGIANHDLKNYFIKTFERNNNELCLRYSNLVSKFEKIEIVFYNLKLEIDKKKIEQQNKETDFKNISSAYEELKYKHIIQANDLNSFKSKNQTLLKENSNLKLIMEKNDDAINSVKDDCIILKKLISTLVDNMNKLEEEQDVLFKETNYEDMLKKRSDIKLEQKENCKLIELLRKKDRNIQKYRHWFQNNLMSFNLWRIKYNEIKHLVQIETKTLNEELSKCKNLIQYLETEEYKSKKVVDGKTIKISKENFKDQINEEQNLLELTKLKTENEVLSEKILDAVINLDILTEENNKIKDSNKILDEEMKKLKESLNSFTNQNTVLNNKNKLINSKYAQLKKENEINKNDLDNNEKNIKIWKNKYEAVSEKVEKNSLEFKMKISLLDKEVQNLKVVNENQLQEIENLKCTNEKINLELVNNLKKYEILLDLKYSKEAEIKTLGHEKEELWDKCKNLELKMLNLVSDKNTLEKRYDEILIEKNAVKVDFEECSNKMNVYISEIDKLNEENEKLEKKIINFVKEIEDLKSVNNNVQSLKDTKLSELASAYEKLQQEMRLNDKMNHIKFQQEINEKNNKIEILKEEVSKLREEIDKLRYTIKALENIESTNDNNTNLELQNKIKFQNEQIINLISENNKIKSELLVFKSEIDNLKILNIEEKEKNEKANIKILNLNEQLTESLLKFQQCKKELESNKSKLVLYTKSKDENKKILEHLRDEVNQLKIKNQSLQEEIDGKQLKQSENWRKLKRYSCHDETRSFFSDPQRDIATMTEPVNDNCNCSLLAQKIAELKKLLLIKDSQINVLNFKVNNNSMKDEIQNLKKSIINFENDKIKYCKEITVLKEEMEYKSQKFSEHLRQAITEEKAEKKKINQMLSDVKQQLKDQAKLYADNLQKIQSETQNQKDKLLKDIEILKQNVKQQSDTSKENLRLILINKEVEIERLVKEINQLKSRQIYDTANIKNFMLNTSVQTEEYEETEVIKNLMKINKDLRVLCRYRNTKINTLKEEIDNIKKSDL